CTQLLSPTCHLAFNQPSTKEIMSTLPFLICSSPHPSSNATQDLRGAPRKPACEFR
ncbi:hypothetical protein PLICRDRAFT_40574, partial [Plicaturopsis crispa FD-325 SS-3]